MGGESGGMYGWGGDYFTGQEAVRTLQALSRLTLKKSNSRSIISVGQAMLTSAAKNLKSHAYVMKKY